MRRCARGLGADDIGRDGTSSGGRAQAHSCTDAGRRGGARRASYGRKSLRLCRGL
nr:MAG TPA: hypothetical protein [Caudoviricetes sp.]